MEAIALRYLVRLRQLTVNEQTCRAPGGSAAVRACRLGYRLRLHTRIDELTSHHEARCAANLEAFQKVQHTVVDLVSVVFGRVVDNPHQMTFAFGEALAHAYYMDRRGELRSAKNESSLVPVLFANQVRAY